VRGPTAGREAVLGQRVRHVARPLRDPALELLGLDANVYNLVTKRAVAYADATVEWVDCNLGSKLTMKYPSSYLLGERAHGEVLSIAFAGAGQHQDAGAKIIHAAPNTTSNTSATRRPSRRSAMKVYLMLHGIPEDEASKLIVNGFIEPIIKQLPMEYAVEMNRLIELQMESSID
jgi:Fe-S cluster assembly protein SufB